jgi:hypothetical protein
VFYGVVKVFHLQMLPPHLSKLVQPLGDASSTSLLWIFMGSSAAYSAFTGAIELLGGVLLFSRRTTTLGALITIAALGNVVMMNLAYDVSVKLWSINLLAMTVLLLVPDLRRLADVLVFNRGSQPVRYEPLFQSPRAARIASRVGYFLLGISMLICLGAALAGRYREYGQEPVALYGIYEVDSFVANGEARPPLLTDNLRWRRVVIERSGLASVHLMNGKNLDYFTSLDTIEHTIQFLANTDTTLTVAGATRLAYNPAAIERRVRTLLEEESSAPITLAYQRTSANELVLSGRWAGDTIAARLRRIDESQFLLLTKGIRWVQSYPYFR